MIKCEAQHVWTLETLSMLAAPCKTCPSHGNHSPMQNSSEQACGWSQILANGQIHVIQFFYFEHVLIV